MRKGDLIFFGSERVTHVGMALNENNYIHAAGKYKRVVISSFDPTDARYDQRLDRIVRDIKRVID
jgi:cell wall-associated NlpC family hydrolase